MVWLRRRGDGRWSVSRKVSEKSVAIADWDWKTAAGAAIRLLGVLNMRMIEGTQSEGNADFSADVDLAVQRVRQTLFESLRSLGLKATIPLQVAKSLGIDKNLSWKVCRIVTEPEPVLVASRMPGRSGIKILAGALRAAGAPNEAVSDVEEAIERFRSVETRHAGDRETFAAMLTGTSDGREREEQDRRKSFLGNSATWGVKAKVQVNVRFLAPSATDGMNDCAMAAGFLGFQRLRNGLPWPLATLGVIYDGDRRVPLDIRTPVDPKGKTADGLPLLPEFCTAPIPSMRLMTLSEGVCRLMIGERPLGRAGAFDIMAGWVMRGHLPAYRSEQDPMPIGCEATQLHTPVELLINDVFVHRSLMYAMNQHLTIHSQLPGGALFPQDGLEAGILPVSCEVESLGSPLDLTTQEFPQFPKLARRMAQAMGHSIDDFEGYRLRLKYPPMPALVALKFDLPERPR
jgi:hypothetical protein